jgi:hypothetical protein
MSIWRWLLVPSPDVAGFMMRKFLTLTGGSAVAIDSSVRYPFSWPEITLPAALLLAIDDLF